MGKVDNPDTAPAKNMTNRKGDETMEVARAWAQCPYCGHKDCHEFKMVQQPITILARCNGEEGGCDKAYVITISWIAKVDVSSIKQEYYHQDFYAESKLFAEVAYYEVNRP